MRILTVRQPWAWAIIHGGKEVENRSRNIAGAYRGPVAIHAGLSEADIDPDHPMYGLINRPCPHEQEPEHNTYVCRSCAAMRRARPRQYSDKGRIIGMVDLVDVHYATGCPEHRDGAPWPLCSPWAMADHRHLVLANPRPLATPIPAKGRLGLWDPDPNLEHTITTALATTGEEVSS